MEGFLPTFPSYNVYGNPLCAPPAQGSSWGKREGRFMIPQGLNYLELCKTILSQVSPSLPSPHSKRANTRECGVQVNARVDKIVQCSLGPKTLLCDERPPSSQPPEGPDAFTAGGMVQFSTPPVSSLRFLRPVSIYSPVFDRRIFARKLSDDCGREEDEASEQAKCDGDTDHSGETPEKDFNASLHRTSKGSNFQVLGNKIIKII